MRYLLLLFILTPLVVKSQFFWPDTTGIVQHLVDPTDSLLRKDTGAVEIRDYNTLQKYLKPMSRHANLHFDFSKKYIGIDFLCNQCMAVCHSSGIHRACHRNRCQYSPYWRVKERTGAYNITYTQVRIGGFSPHLQENKRRDTLIIYEKNLSIPLEENGPEYIYLHAILGGDCFATFTHEIFQDDEKKTITWIIHNHYGGCRSGYHGYAYMRIKNPGAGYTFVFNEWLEH